MTITFTAVTAINMNQALPGINFLTDTFDSGDIPNSAKDVTNNPDKFVWRANASTTLTFRGVLDANFTLDIIDDNNSTITSLAVTSGGVSWSLFNFAVSLNNIGVINPIASFLSGGDNFTGSAGNDVLNGFAGNDKMNGNGGDDTLNGAANDDILNGGPGNDHLNGGPGLDKLDGGPGADVMNGGNDADTFFFRNAANPGDKIVAFNTSFDKIGLDHQIFVGLGPIGQPLAAAKFHIGNNATTAAQRIIYDPDTTPNTGTLFYDSNGSGAGGKQVICKLDDGLLLHASNFFVI